MVLSGIFKICQDLFGNSELLFLLFMDVWHSFFWLMTTWSLFFICEGLRFEEIADAEVWHPDVQLISVFDLNSNELLGHFYLDLYSRFTLLSAVIRSFVSFKVRCLSRYKKLSCTSKQGSKICSHMCGGSSKLLINQLHKTGKLILF